MGYLVVGAICLLVGAFFGNTIKADVSSLEAKVVSGLASIEAAIKAGKL